MEFDLASCRVELTQGILDLTRGILKLWFNFFDQDQMLVKTQR